MSLESKQENAEAGNKESESTSFPTEKILSENQAANDAKSTVSKSGINVDLDKDGKPIAYRSNGYSFELHADKNTWYYHQDSGGDYVKINVPTVSEDGSVHTKENGGFHAGREHTLNATGQSTQSSVSSTFELGKRYAASTIDYQNKNRALLTVPSLGIPSKVIDNKLGTNFTKLENKFLNSFGDKLVDGTVNGIVYLGGLGQGGLEKIGVLPDWKQVDQAVPQLNLYEDFNRDKQSFSENIAGRLGQAATYLVPVGGEAHGAVKALQVAVKLGRIGQTAQKVGEFDVNSIMDLVLGQ